MSFHLGVVIMVNIKDKKKNCDVPMKGKFQLLKATDHAQETAPSMHYLQEKIS